MENKIIRKTYAARGLLDFQMALDVYGAMLRICFSGGSMGSNGVVPAKYTTSNIAIQHLIEKSPQFKSNRIFLHTSETYVKNPKTGEYEKEGLHGKNRH